MAKPEGRGGTGTEELENRLVGGSIGMAVRMISAGDISSIGLDAGMTTDN
jgi:hypothetical protein